VKVVEVSGLVRRYGDLVAVDDLDLAVEAGECVAMLGPNGAGKTTTVEILEGYRHRDQGRVEVLGIDPARANRAWRERIGLVLQSAADLLDATAAEAITHFARYYPHPRSTTDVLALVGLSDRGDVRVGQLSGGQRRRLDVGLGVVGRPELLFLDEPTTGFDPEARRTFWQLIENLKAEGVTILLTTHYLEEADALADRVVVVAKGRKVADTTPGALGSRHDGRTVVRWREGDVVREVSTTTPTALVGELAMHLRGEVPGLEVLRPTLEQAYLELVEEP
jgi:ABC-2 type transport system ATP-binding protein